MDQEKDSTANTCSVSDEKTNHSEDEAPPLTTFEVPTTEPLTSAVSSMFTLPEMYHGTNLYPSVDEDEDEEAPVQHLQQNGVDPQSKQQEKLKAESDNDNKKGTCPPDEMLIQSLTATEDILFEVQPLPEPGTSSQGRGPQEPGAHAIVSSRSSPHHTRPLPPAAAPNTNSTDVVFDATVVDDCCHDNTMEQGDASASVTVMDNSNSLASSMFHHHNRSNDMVIDGKILEERTGPASGSTTCSGRIHKRKVTWVLCALLAGALVVLLVVLLVSLTAGKEGSTTSKEEETDRPTTPTTTSAPTAEESWILYPPFQETLPMALKKSIQEVGSAFYYANQWMIEDPSLSSYSEAQQRQRFYLAMFYHATNGDHWLRNDHWMSYEISECDWYSHSSLPNDSDYFVPHICNGNGTMISFSLAQNNLTGILPLFPVALLPHLQVVDIDGNNLSGLFPPVVSNDEMEVIILSNNHFVERHRGDFLFFNLRVLKTENNQLTNGVPNQEGVLLEKILQRTFEVWAAQNNLFGGPLPSELGLCRQIKYFSRGSLLTGSIPSQYGLLDQLTTLDVARNPGINGTLPTELGNMASLANLDIWGTSISGSIPEGLCDRVREGILEIKANCSRVICC